MEEQGRSLVIKIDREAVMKIAVNGDLFTLKKGMHELNLTLGGVPFKADGLVNQVLFTGGSVFALKVQCVKIGFIYEFYISNSLTHCP